MVNWKVRFKNKAFVITFISTVLAFIYQMLGLFDIVPKISESDVANLIIMIVNMLAAVGIITDPTTKGLDDSERALKYDEPA